MRKEARNVEHEDFIEYRNKVYELYLQGRYSEALEIAEKAYARFSDEASRTSYWLACFNSLLHKEDKAIEILTNSLGNGVWWSPKMLEGEKDLDPLKNREEFKRIVERCWEIFEEKRKESKPEKLVFYPDTFDSEKKYPLFVALHWKGGNMQEFSKYWKHVLKRGYILLVPQSSQLSENKAYCWDDWEKAKKEVTNHITEIRERHNLIEDGTVVAGASQGASLGMVDLVLEDTPLNLKRFIAVVPPIEDVSFFIPLLKNGVRKGVKGYVLAGEKDRLTKNTEDLCSEMEKAGLPHKLTVVKGLGHDFPSDFDVYLDEALDYMEARQS
jgi:predicted esterase